MRPLCPRARGSPGGEGRDPLVAGVGAAPRTDPRGRCRDRPPASSSWCLGWCRGRGSRPGDHHRRPGHSGPGSPDRRGPGEPVRRQGLPRSCVRVRQGGWPSDASGGQRVRRTLTLVTLISLVVMAPSPALAGELDDLLERSGQAAYTAEQTISCSTPDGARDAVVRIVQDGPQLSVTSTADEGSKVLSGAGDWSLRRGEGVVSRASVKSTGNTAAPVYEVERVGPIVFLDRAAMRYRLNRDGVQRAELTFDLHTGALVASTTFNADGSPYCRRRFVSFEPGVPELTAAEQAPPSGVEPVDTDLGLPEVVAGFQRLDQYRDEEGIGFAYFSDGFFSFAAFEARS